ncbi:Mu transposase C-terminal domain-containing protein [uncultured Tateyamaria sp.]|uniref:Mu transposase C-terminal domain-containing protein n=1 Tax=uncultured Tateyamaria sp. TaxID=455651 RepID=UPI0026308B67|nr:Mu transposase C-terminal domain-containing protein [uncultured Tateyamaria sp.]
MTGVTDLTSRGSTSHIDVITRTTKLFFTAAEIADLARKYGVESFPKTERAVRDYAKRESWNTLPEHLCRKRAGRGGGLEYHFSLLPSFLWDRIEGEAIGKQLTDRFEQKQHAAQRKVEKLKTTSLSQRARSVMEARASVLNAIEGYALSQGQTRAWGIRKFLEAQTDWEAIEKAEAERDNSKKLSGEDAMLVFNSYLLTREGGFGIIPDILQAARDRRTPGPVKRSTVYNWFKARDEHGVAALSPIPPKVKQNTIDLYPWLIQFLRHYAKPSKPSIPHALDNFEKSSDRTHEVPSYDQVRRAIKTLKGASDHLMVHKGREGPLALKARSAFVSRSIEGLEPGTIYTADGKTFDAEVQHPRHGKPFRPEITTIIDVATRKAVGWSVGLDENAELVALAVLHAAQNHGIPAIFYADRGSGYKNQRISTTAHGLCARLGTTATHSLPYNSQARGAIERVHGTIWNRLAKDYPSYMGKDMDPEAAKKVFKESRRALQIIEGKRQIEDPKTLQKAQQTYARLIVSWQQFVEDVDAAIVEYNNAPHSSLRIRDPENGRMRSASPNEVWAQFEATGFQAFRLDPGEADDLYRPYEKRKTNRALVEIHTNSYFSLALEPWHGEYVFVGYDIHDAQQVWVRQIEKLDGQEVPGPLICVAEFSGNERRYMPASFQDLAEERRLKGRMRRHQAKAEEIEAEARPQLEHQQVVELALPPLRSPEPAPANAVEAEVLSFQPGPSSPTPQPDRRNPFQDADLDLAWSIVEAPDDYEIPHGHIRLMSALLGNKAFLDMMREVGLPLTDLADRIAAAQSPRKSSNGD